MIPREVTDLLQQYHIHLHPDWISQCIAYLSTTQSSPNNHALAQGVLQQVLHSDLANMGVPILPPNISEAHNLVLGETHSVFLQLNDIMEVGISANALLEAIQEDKPKRGDPQPPQQQKPLPRKMLRLTLSDGYQEVLAMELALLPGISVESLLGAKILITNALVRRGVILLRPENFQLLGGFVADMNQGEPRVRLETLCRNLLGHQ
ncbi:hypothetical protein BC832DRAFT_387823 [Gaertneriomyces semiglobifer]|nr:hypothetical protein BC832DRAFT_387823 [Gaertneriomyces semiglobifer]